MSESEYNPIRINPGACRGAAEVKHLHYRVTLGRAWVELQASTDKTLNLATKLGASEHLYRFGS